MNTIKCDSDILLSAAFDTSYPTEGHVDFLNVCRTCRRSVTDDYHKLNKSMHEMIEASTGVMMNSKDNLPGKICNMCYRTIQFAYAFRLECQKVDAILRSCGEAAVAKAHTSGELHQKCTICNKLFRQSSELEQHIKVEHDINNLDVSSDTLKTEQSGVGVGGHSGERNQEVPTKTQAFLYFRRPSVKEPLRKLTREPPELHRNSQKGKHYFSCNLCSWKSEIYRSVISHYINYHTSRTAPHQCPLCSDKLNRRTDLRNHLQRHVNLTYKCRYCGVHCGQASTLRRHLLCHMYERPYKCTDCNKTFKHNNSLKVHLQGHVRRRNLTGESLEVCNEPLEAEELQELHYFPIVKRELLDESLEVAYELEGENIEDLHLFPPIKRELLDIKEEEN